MRRIRTCCLGLLFLIAPVPAGLAQDREPLPVREPEADPTVDTLETRKASQLRALPSFRVPTGFQFTDRLLESGIDFRHQSVEDSAKNWMPVHYDHGNGVAVADVDGDERLDLYFVSQLGGNRLYRNLGRG